MGCVASVLHSPTSRSSNFNADFAMPESWTTPIIPAKLRALPNCARSALSCNASDAGRSRSAVVRRPCATAARQPASRARAAVSLAGLRPLTAGSDANRDRDDAERAGARHESRHLAPEPEPALELPRSEKDRFGVIVNGLGRRPIDGYRKEGLLRRACGDRSTIARNAVRALSL